MPIQVNEHAINELAALTGIEADKLKSELVVDAPEPPKETKIKEILADVVIMKKTDHATLLDNHGKNKFDEGKYRNMVDFTKLALGEKAFEVSKDMTRESVWEKIAGTKKSEWEKEAGKEPDKRVQELQTEKQKLQELVATHEQEKAKLMDEFEKTKTFSTAREKVLAAVTAIPFEATGEVLSKQRDVVIKNILSSYQHKIEDGVSVWYDSNGKKLVDTLQNPKTIEDIAKEEAIIFPTTKSSAGRGDNSSKQTNQQSGELDAELVKLNAAEFSTFLSGRRLSPLSEEGKALMARWVELQSKKA